MAIRPLLLVKPATAVKWHRKGFSIFRSTGGASLRGYIAVRSARLNDLGNYHKSGMEQGRITGAVLTEIVLLSFALQLAWQFDEGEVVGGRVSKKMRCVPQCKCHTAGWPFHSGRACGQSAGTADLRSERVN
jgi:hypothetical protein